MGLEVKENNQNKTKTTNPLKNPDDTPFLTFVV